MVASTTFNTDDFITTFRYSFVEVSTLCLDNERRIMAADDGIASTCRERGSGGEGTEQINIFYAHFENALAEAVLTANLSEEETSSISKSSEQLLLPHNRRTHTLYVHPSLLGKDTFRLLFSMQANNLFHVPVTFVRAVLMQMVYDVGSNLTTLIPLN